MPISSTNHRLTQELYKPPPKSLEQLRMEEMGIRSGVGGGRSNAITPTGSNMVTPTGSPMMREKHLLHGPQKKTAVVEPVTDFQKSRLNGNFIGNGNGGINNGGVNGVAKDGGFGKGNDWLKNGGVNGVATTGAVGKGGFGAAGTAGGAMGKSAGCCLFQGFWCTRCCWLIFLLGLLLGALITGLVTGLVLGGRLEGALAAAAAASTATTAAPEEPVGCFQSPCPSANAVCGNSNNGTVINCDCQDGDPVSSAEVTASRYTCILSNDTETNTGIPMTTIMDMTP